MKHPSAHLHRRLFTVTLACLLGALLLWLCLAPANRPVSYRLQVPSPLTIDTPLQLTVTVNSLLPPSTTPSTTPPLDARLAVPYHATTTLAGLSWRGLLWHQHLQIYPVTLDPIPSTSYQLGDLPLVLPELTPQLPPDLPEAPVILPPKNSSPSPAWLCLCLLPLLLLPVIILRLRRRPLAQLRRLPCVPESLDALPALLNQASPPVSAQSHPAFFHALDDLRFAKDPPAPEHIQHLLRQAQDLLTNQHA